MGTNIADVHTLGRQVKSIAQLLLAIIGLLAVTRLGWAADLSPAVAAPPVSYSWTGLYIGLNVGYASANLSETVSGGGGSGSASIPGGIGGAQIGYNYQTGPLVLGFEADFDGNMATKSITAGIATGTAQIPWIGTLRGKVGYAFDRFMIYATAGGAAMQLGSTMNIDAFGPASTTFTHGAWTAGAGLEAAVTNNLSARVEYLYVDTGNFDVAQFGPPVTSVTGQLHDNLVRAGVNYRLPVAW